MGPCCAFIKRMQICSLTAYRELLRLALSQGWTFCRYETDVRNLARALYLRHDVDYSLDSAVELARTNANLGVRGTFFLLLRSNLYNLLAPRNLKQARLLVDCGQDVGLHFAALDPPPQDPRDVLRLVQQELDLFRREIPQSRPIVAWHNPTAPWLQRFADLELPQLVNVYHRTWTKDICYQSDSNLRNRPEDFATLLRRSTLRRLHLLFHPINWTIGGNDMVEIFAGAWRQVIREREDEFQLNRVYQQTFPNGMPSEILEKFAHEWSAAARRAA